MSCIIMKSKERKKIQAEYAKKNIDFFFNLLETRFRPDFDKFYVREIIRFSQGFNVRLTRDEKLKFCKKCSCFWNQDSRLIRINSDLKTKEYICKSCGFRRRFKF